MTKALLLAFTLLISLAPAISMMSIPAVHAESTGPYAMIFPPTGTVYTSISIEVRNLTHNVHYHLYLHWDNVDQIQALDNPSYWPMGSMSPTWLPYYNVEINAPNEHPLSDLGDHTILIQIWTFDYTQLAFNSTLTFKIIEQLPCNEWLALNATYYDLLADYEVLNASYYGLEAGYSNLLADYSSLSAEYTSLLSEYNSLLSDYGSLSDSYATMMLQYNSLSTSYSTLLNTHSQLQSSYNSLSASNNALTQSYNQLQSNYNSLNSNVAQLQSSYNGLNRSLSQVKSDYSGLTNSYSSLQINYNSLQGNYNSLQASYSSLNMDYDSLKSIHDSLKADFDSLELNNSDLTTSYNALVGELIFTRNLGYVFIMTTMILAATAVYFAARKPRTKTV